MKTARRRQPVAGGRDNEQRESSNAVSSRFQPDPELAHQHLVRRVRDVVLCTVPRDRTILVISDGDEDFLNRIHGRRPLHFPHWKGAWAGHPIDSAAAIALLERGREAGAHFLVVPDNSMWWLERYPGFADHLERNYRRIAAEAGTCAMYGLSREALPIGERDPRLEPEWPGLSPIRAIAPGDQGYRADPDNYFHWAWHGLRCVEQALQAARKRTVESILDLPSGHGRVLRTLKAMFPEAKLTACDIDRDGVDFCAEVFGATPVYSKEDPAEIVLPDSYDLIWCGSLLTHLSADRWPGFLELFKGYLRVGGVLVFTTHGRLYAELIRNEAINSSILDPEQLIRDFDHDGFAYQDYMFGPPSYGFSVSSRSWVCRELERHPELRLLLYSEREWGNLQDSIACVRAPDDEIDATVAALKADESGQALASEYQRLTQYRDLIHRVREVSREALPRDATVAVVSRGDDHLVQLEGVTGWHFPRDEHGGYTGHYPPDSAAAIEHLEQLRAQGAEYLLLPATAFWWLEHYAEFAEHLESRYPKVVQLDDVCSIFRLAEERR